MISKAIRSPSKQPGMIISRFQASKSGLERTKVKMKRSPCSETKKLVSASLQGTETKTPE
jgi:hypothetical protein